MRTIRRRAGTGGPSHVPAGATEDDLAQALANDPEHRITLMVYSGILAEVPDASEDEVAAALEITEGRQWRGSH